MVRYTQSRRKPEWYTLKNGLTSNGLPVHPIGHELYDVKNDPSEKINLSGHPGYAEIQQSLDFMLADYFNIHAGEVADL